MTSESDSMSNGWIPWWLWWGGMGLFSFFLLLFGTYYGLTWKWKADFEEQIQKLKKEGHPHSPEALQKAYKKRAPNRKDYSDWSIPESLRNISIKNHELTSSFNVPLDKWMSKSPESRTKKSQQMLAVLNKHKSALQDQLDIKIHPIKYDFPKRSTNLTSFSLARLSEGKIFSFYTQALIETGKLKQALSVLRTLYRRGCVIRQEPLLTSLRVSNGITNYANSNMQFLLLQNEIPTETIDAFPSLCSEKMKEDFLFTLEGVMIQGAHSLKKAIKDGTVNAESNFSAFPSLGKHDLGYWLPSGLFWLPASNYLRTFRMHLRLFQKPYYKIKTKLEGTKKTRYASKGNLERFATLYTHYLMNSHKHYYEQLNDQRVRLKLLHLGVKAKLRSQNEGTGLTPIPQMDEPTDPYSGKPYKVKETNSHVILYSVGKNLKDDGGSIEEQNGNDPKDLGVKIKK